MTIRTKLAEEAQRYLAVVDFFRAQGCEPHWRPERDAGPPVDPVPADPPSTR